MSRNILIKGITMIILSLIFVWGIFSRYHEESGVEKSASNQQKYLPFIVGNLLPACILAVTVFGLFTYGVQETIKLIVSVCFGVFLHTSLYYIVLIVTIPLLRKHISARTCAVLWMIPNYLYIAFYDYMNMNEPLLVIRAPQNVVWLLFGIWLAGFFIVLFGNIALHFIFRLNLLNEAKKVTDLTILEIWNRELESANMQYKKYPVMISPDAKTPLSVGLFRRKTCVVLPDKEYSSEELSLIFRHEIVHIGREDAWSKFFLLFCTAMCWFNPLMWIAMRKSAEDMELSCDETVLLNEDDETRRQYVSLILSTAGNQRGFTTCLSASASAMRYRLKNIMKTKIRRSGVVVVGIVFFVLFMSYGYVALAYGGGTGREIVYQSKDCHSYKLDQLYFGEKDSNYHTIYECVNEDALYEYISGLTIQNLTGKYTFSDSDQELHISYDTPKGNLYVTLSDHMIRVIPAYEKDVETLCYYIAKGIDWEYLEEIIVDYPALNIQFFGEKDIDPTEISATTRMIKRQEAGNSLVVYESNLSEESASGLYGSHTYERLRLQFSQELLSECTIVIEAEEGNVKENLLLELRETDVEIPLVQYPAYYNVQAKFLGTNREVYDMEFQFYVGEFKTESLDRN